MKKTKAKNKKQKNLANKQFTYQIGWKRGKIKLDPQKATVNKDKVIGKQDPPPLVLPDWLLSMERGLVNVVWRPIPALPRQWVGPILWLVPVLSFAITLFLIRTLME